MSHLIFSDLQDKLLLAVLKGERQVTDEIRNRIETALLLERGEPIRWELQREDLRVIIVGSRKTASGRLVYKAFSYGNGGDIQEYVFDGKG